MPALLPKEVPPDNQTSVSQLANRRAAAPACPRTAVAIVGTNHVAALDELESSEWAIVSSRPVPLFTIVPKLQVIVGSTRAAERVFPWVVERPQRHGAFDLELLDLRDWQLPFFQEHMGTIGDFSDPTYSDPTVKAWNKKTAEGDAYLIVTAE